MRDKDKQDFLKLDKTIYSKEVLDNEKQENQLILMKKQVKCIMEEVVMKKFIHEESPSVLQLCATVEECLLDEVNRRTSGFLRSNKIANIYTKVAKVIPAVGELIKQIEEAEAKLERSNEEYRLDHLSLSTNIFTAVNGQKNNGKHLWVRMALTNKLLDKIVDHLVLNSRKFYNESSIMADPVRGQLIATLLVGPCTLDYTKLRTQDHYWTDPPADELLQRHKLHSRAKPRTRGKRPTLNLTPLHPTSSSDSLDCNACFREYVESLHQNSKISLLYGKNNVIIRPEEGGPVPGYLSLHQDGTKVMIKWTPNQLMHEEEEQKNSAELHRNGGTHVKKQDSLKKSGKQQLRKSSSQSNGRLSSFWKFVISVDIRDIVYLHCHHQVEKGGSLVLVGQDGVQWPPILFPPGGHLLSFLSCLENGLRPFGFLDPPLWSEKGKGKVFPRLRRRSHRRSESSCDSDDLTDFVFRVGFTSDSSNVTSSTVKTRLPPKQQLMRPVTSLPHLWNKSISNSVKKSEPTVKPEPESKPSISRSVVIKRDLNSRSPISVVQSTVQPDYQDKKTKNKSQKVANQSGVFESAEEYVPNLDMYTWDQNQPRHYNEPDEMNASNHPNKAREGSLMVLCESMRRQILFRAFNGWLAYCRHISGVRTHLTALVNPTILDPVQPTNARMGITEEVWESLAPNGILGDMKELARFVYFGGVKATHLRPLIWKYLLGHYSPRSTGEEREQADQEARLHYDEIRAVDEEIKKVHGCDVIETQGLMQPNPVQRCGICGSNTKSSLLVGSCENYNGTTAIPVNALLSSSIERSSWSSEYVPAPMTPQMSTCSDVFTPGPETANNEKFELPDGEMRRGSKKSRSLREKRKKPLKRAQSDDSHIPYSSVSTTTSFDPASSYSMKSFSFDGDYDGLRTVQEESERSSNPDVKAIFSSADTGSSDKTERLSSYRRQTDSSSLRSESIDPISLNLTQIEKDVHRCDRNHNYFTQQSNLQKLSNIMSCFVWEHPEIGYVQGMCDLAAPLLVLFDEESLVYSCFVKLMQRITFQKGNQMDIRLDNLRSLVQALDSELFDHLRTKNDQVPFFFCYRWFLLEFKRELSYDEDVFAVWECSWAATTCSTPDFGLFFALAMLQNYRDVILENNMDFPGIVKFFNEMAEKHNAAELLELARKLIHGVQSMIEK